MLLGFILLMGLAAAAAGLLFDLNRNSYERVGRNHRLHVEERRRRLMQERQRSERLRQERISQLQRKAERQDDKIDEVDQQLAMFTFDIEKLKEELTGEGYAINPPASDLEIELEVGPAAAITLNARLIETIQALWDKAEAEANRDPRSWSDEEVSTWDKFEEVRAWSETEPVRVIRTPNPGRSWDW